MPLSRVVAGRETTTMIFARISSCVSRSVAAGIGIVCLFSISAQAGASVAAGEKLARLWCASCHVVASDQEAGNPDTPPFSEIAERADLSEASMEIWLAGTHPVMPDMSLSRAEIAALVAYIESFSAN
ncbi:cytochrome c [Breoghania sp.]|uniref:c-type cytochrome n=1 Tax=Breoghania sp. TaxID=2065378 RepID=UPI002AA8DF03|nr:cytochrome c [Breoghania sp.]